MKTIRRIFAVLTGVVFYIAGLLKLMDPVGSSLIVGEYLQFLHLAFLGGLAKTLAVILSLLETIVGAALVTGVLRKATALVCSAMVLFFTILTFFLWRLDPPMDCGCFGEAFHLTHLQTLYKNLLLCIFCLVAFLPPHKLGSPRRSKIAAFGITALSTLAFCIYSLIALPLKDYTPLACGTELSKEGEEGLEDLPALSFFSPEGEYCDSLAISGKVMIVSVYNTERIRDWDRLNSFLSEAGSAGFTPLLLVAGDSPADRYFFADGRTLMTLNRSNGGATFVSDGRIVEKWAYRFLPSAQKLAETEAADPVTTITASLSSGKLRFQGFLLYVFAVMLLL